LKGEGSSETQISGNIITTGIIKSKDEGESLKLDLDEGRLTGKRLFINGGGSNLDTGAVILNTNPSKAEGEYTVDNYWLYVGNENNHIAMPYNGGV
jgi:hypothetical protein